MKKTVFLLAMVIAVFFSTFSLSHAQYDGYEFGIIKSNQFLKVETRLYRFLSLTKVLVTTNKGLEEEIDLEHCVFVRDIDFVGAIGQEFVVLYCYEWLGGKMSVRYFPTNDVGSIKRVELPGSSISTRIVTGDYIYLILSGSYYLDKNDTFCRVSLADGEVEKISLFEKAKVYKYVIGYTIEKDCVLATIYSSIVKGQRKVDIFRTVSSSMVQIGSTYVPSPAKVSRVVVSGATIYVQYDMWDAKMIATQSGTRIY